MTSNIDRLNYLKQLVNINFYSLTLEELRRLHTIHTIQLDKRAMVTTSEYTLVTLSHNESNETRYREVHAILVDFIYYGDQVIYEFLCSPTEDLTRLACTESKYLTDWWLIPHNRMSE